MLSGSEFVSSVRVDRTIVAVDVPNVLGSASRAAGNRRDARFKYHNIYEAIARSPSPGYAVREIVAAHAVMLVGDRPDMQRKTQANLESAGFRVLSVVQKYPVTSSDPDVHQGDEGVTDLELTNTVWDVIMRQLIAGQPVNTVVLVSGDGDFKGLLYRIRELGIRVEVYGPLGSTSRALQSIAHKTVLMSEATPVDVPENKRFIIFKPDDDYTFERALADASNPYFVGSVTGEFATPVPPQTSRS